MEGKDFIVNTVFVDTNLDTHLAIIVSDNVTVSDLKDKIVIEHLQCFPIIGQIKINALKVKRKGYFYHLSDSMLVRSAFDGPKKNWFLTIDVSKPDVDIPGPIPKAGTANESPSQKPDRKSDLQINSSESDLLKSPPDISDVGKDSNAEPIHLLNESKKPRQNQTAVVVDKGESETSQEGGVEGSPVSSGGCFPKSGEGPGVGFIPGKGVNPDSPGGVLVKQAPVAEKKKRAKKSETPVIRNEAPLNSRLLGEVAPEGSLQGCLNPGDVAESPAGVHPEENVVLEKEQKESPQLKNTGTSPPEKKEKRKYTKRKAVSPAITNPDIEPVRSKAVQSKVRKVTSKMTPNVHVDNPSAQTSVDRGIPRDGSNVSGKTAEIGTEPAADSFAQIKTESGLTVDQKSGNEVVNSIAGSRKAGKKNNSVPAVPKHAPIKDRVKKMAVRPQRVESISTADAENGYLVEYVQKGVGDGPYLSDQTGLGKRRGDEEKATGVINPNKNPDDRDDSAKLMKTRTRDTKVSPSAMEESEKIKAAGEPRADEDSSGVSGSSDSDSDCSEKTTGNGSQEKVEEYLFASRGMEKAKSDVIVARIPVVGGALDSPSFSVSGGSELASNQSRDSLGQGSTGAPEKKEKKRYKKPIADPLPLIAEEKTSGSDPDKDNVIYKVDEGKKRRKVKPKKQDIPDTGISLEPPVNKISPSYSGIGNGKVEKTGTDPVNGGVTEKKHEPQPGDGIVRLTVDVNPGEQVEISAPGSRKGGKKKTRQEKTVSPDLSGANELQKGGGGDQDLGSQYLLKKRGEDGEEKTKLENHVSREEYIPDVVGIATTELENGVSNSDDTWMPQIKEKRKYKKRKAEPPLPLITEDKSSAPPYMERESVPAEAGDVKRRKAKPKKQVVSDDYVPSDAGDRITDKMETDDITGHSAEKKTEPGFGGNIGHLAVDAKPGAEFNKSNANSKKGGKKKNLVSPDLKNTPITDKGKKAVARPSREESVSPDESRKVNKTHGIKISGSAVEEPVKGGVDETESSGSSGSDSDISEKALIFGNGGQSKVDDYRLAARRVERGKSGEAVAGLNGGAHSPSIDSPSASSETTSTDSRDPPHQGIQRSERKGSRDSSSHIPKKGVKLEAILRSSSRFKKMKVTSDEMGNDDFAPV